MYKKSVIVERADYDKDGYTVYAKLGNVTETEYAYDDVRQRLQEMSLKNHRDWFLIPPTANGDELLFSVQLDYEGRKETHLHGRDKDMHNPCHARLRADH